MYSISEQFSTEAEGEWVKGWASESLLVQGPSVMRLQGDKSLWDLTGCHIPGLRVLAAPLPWAQLFRALLYRLLMLFPEQALCPLQFTHLPFHNSSMRLNGASISFVRWPTRTNVPQRPKTFPLGKMCCSFKKTMHIWSTLSMLTLAFKTCCFFIISSKCRKKCATFYITS